MEALPIDRTARLVLTGFLVLWAGLLVFGFLLGTPDPDRTRRLPLFARMAMSSVLVLSALLWWRLGTAGTALATFGRWIFVGMLFGFLGDLLMAEVLPSPNRVIFGILAFGIGHVAYIAGYGQLSRVLGLDASSVRVIAIGAFLLAGALLWYFLVRNPAQPAVMNYGTLGYALLLAVMTALATSVAVQEGAFWPLGLGTLSFLASDLILGAQIMRGSSWFLISDAVWLTYTVGQMLIVFSSAIALRLVAAL